MKILHINSYYSVSGFYKNLYDEQKKKGLDISVYVPVSTKMDISKFNLGEYSTISKNHGKYDRFVFHLKHKKIINDITKRYTIDEFSLIHAHSLFSNGYIALNLKKNFGIPYIVAVRNTDVNVFLKRMIHLRKLGVEILKEAENIIFLSESYRENTIEKYVPNKLNKYIYNKSMIIPNGIDDFWFQNLGEPKLSLDKENLNLLYVGLINKNKNIITTINAIKILQERGFNIKFTIVGKVEDESIFQAIKDLYFINYIPPKSKEELKSIYRSNDIFIMPSLTETFGLVYAEAMSQGLPVIYSKGQGFDGQFEEGFVGYHVNSSNEEEIADRIIDISSKYNIMSKNCLEKVKKFDWGIIEKRYFDNYKVIHNRLEENYE